MSTRTYDSGSFENGSTTVASTASRAASMIDNRLHWGADAVSTMAHQAADQLEHASEYVWNKSEKLRERASGVATYANDHPLYTLLAVGMMGVGLGFLLRGGRRG